MCVCTHSWVHVHTMVYLLLPSTLSSRLSTCVVLLIGYYVSPAQLRYFSPTHNPQPVLSQAAAQKSCNLLNASLRNVYDTTFNTREFIAAFSNRFHLQGSVSLLTWHVDDSPVDPQHEMRYVACERKYSRKVCRVYSEKFGVSNV